MSTLRNRAKEIREKNAKIEMRDSKILNDLYTKYRKQAIVKFEQVFERFLPMFKEEEISYEYHLNDINELKNPSFSEGGYIQFRQNHKTLKMDCRYVGTLSFRFKYTCKTPDESASNMQYLFDFNQPQNEEKFILFIVEGLIEKPEPPVHYGFKAGQIFN